MLAPLALPLLLVLAPQEPRATPEEPAARGAQRVERSAEKPAEKPADKPAEKAADKPPEKEEAPVVTKHELRLAGGRVLRYSVTTGLMPLKSDTGEVEARVFFMAYTLDRTGGPETRPLMFSFNGGPGSSSVWLHLGALGPKRVKMRTDGAMPSPPYRLVDNEHTWLDDTDLVFIDPVGTGYSRPAKPELGKKYWGVQGDIESVGEFIRLYLTRHERWASPLFLVGESYGTTRAAGLSGYLVEKGIAFNGILLVSSILNFQTARFSNGNDLPYPLFLPTYAATAWYHKQLPADLQAKPLAEFLREVETFAAADYPNALQKGDRMGASERQDVVKRLARYTGLSETYVDESDLRIEIQRFCKELLRRDGHSVGRLDTRFRGTDSSRVAERPEFDPRWRRSARPTPPASTTTCAARSATRPTPCTTSSAAGSGRRGTSPRPTASPTPPQALGDAFAKNPDMRLFVASGFYDLATPYFATQYTLSHMGLDAEQRARISTGQYEAGHMMYIHEGELARLKQDVAKFIASALPKP